MPEATSIQELPNVKALAGASNRYRIRVGDYRIGFEVNEDGIQYCSVKQIFGL
ncbi:type II toxin-antitoxin system RelE family toxin [[Phormidium] sp. LEGE 05292]|uniref:type II toxin-antitoxin system RelE family toxin n=1 Tax=[Phormidium] sp. LEGE 05292 TaxID=767427 RepID=UPI001D15470E|nr:hypothetical protein [Phormidium sp. LEGE 05292]